MDIGELSGCRLYTGLRLHYRLRLWAPTSTSRAVSAVAELLVHLVIIIIIIIIIIILSYNSSSEVHATAATCNLTLV